MKRQITLFCLTMSLFASGDIFAEGCKSCVRREPLKNTVSESGYFEDTNYYQAEKIHIENTDQESKKQTNLQSPEQKDKRALTPTQGTARPQNNSKAQ